MTPQQQDLAAARERQLRLQDQQDPPRVDIDRLLEVWNHIEQQIAAHAVARAEDPVFLRELSRFNGWNQGSWRATHTEGNRCETNLCLAGWVVELDGQARGLPDAGWLIGHQTLTAAFLHNALGQPWPDSVDAWQRQLVDMYPAEYLLADERDSETSVDTLSVWVQDTNREVRVVTAAQRARHLLGLTGDEADELFASGNRLARMRGLVHSYVAEERVRRLRRETVNGQKAKKETDANPDQSDA